MCSILSIVRLVLCVLRSVHAHFTKLQLNNLIKTNSYDKCGVPTGFWDSVKCPIPNTLCGFMTSQT